MTVARLVAARAHRALRPSARPALAAAALAVAGASACDRIGATVRPFRGAAVEPAQAAPALRLPTVRGDTFDLARATVDSGRAALVFFGYTHCPDVCPTTLADWTRVRRLLGDDAERVRFVFVTVDPERDSVAVVRRYVAQFDTAFVGLAPSRAGVDAALRAWGLAAYPEVPVANAGDGAYTVAHPAQTFAVDAEGRLRVLYPLNAPPADVADDLRRLLD